MQNYINNEIIAEKLEMFSEFLIFRDVITHYTDCGKVIQEFEKLISILESWIFMRKM